MGANADPMIRQIVGRCHVGRSHRSVIRYVVSRLRQGYSTWRTLPREARREILRNIIAQHDENRAEYRSVMSGRL
jgi:acyl-CoA reductase-like NAD-dependent aldehyde dehydrogenase